MATCGNCKEEGKTVAHIKDCYAQSRGGVLVAEKPVEASTFQPMALSFDVPASQYALDRGGEIVFFQVRVGKVGTRWDGYRFVDRLIGHPGDWMKIPVKGAERKLVLEAIARDAKAAAVRFSREFTICAVCGSPLSDPESMAAGLGPVCAGRF